MKSLVVLSVLLLCLLSAASAEDEPVDASKIEVSLIPDLPSVPLGEPTYLSFIVKNNSNQDVQIAVGGDYRNELCRPESFKVRVLDEAGDPVPQIDPGPTMGGFMTRQKIAALGSYRFRLFLPHWASFKRPGRYLIRVERTLRILAAGRNLAAPATTLDAHATTSIEILPPDPERLGKLIDTLGRRLLDPTNPDHRESSQMLDAIGDERVIQHYLRALRADSYSLKFDAVRALGRFNNDDALVGLKEALRTTGEDIADTATPELAERSADQIRHAAAVGLRETPHPGGVPFLLLQRGDRSTAVRRNVVQAIAEKLEPDEAIPLLQGMVNDPEEQVRRDAARYLEKLNLRQ